MAKKTGPRREKTERRPRVRRRLSSQAADAASRLQALVQGGGSVSEVMVALRKAGIKDLEDLVKRVIGTAQAEDEALDVFAPVSEPQAGASFSHRPPKIPFTVAGVTYDPADIKRFDGQPLHFLYRTVGDAAELIGFVGNEWVRAVTAYAQLRLLGGLAAPAAGYGTLLGGVAGGYHPYPHYPYYPSPGKGAKQHVAGLLLTEAPTFACSFWEHANFRGRKLVLRARRAYRDLTKAGGGFLSFSSDWNDIISSVQLDGAAVRLFEHTNYEGDSLSIFPTAPTFVFIPNLELLGWNDRVSSIQNLGQLVA
jgi:hypothetical protein